MWRKRSELPPQSIFDSLIIQSTIQRDEQESIIKIWNLYFSSAIIKYSTLYLFLHLLVISIAATITW